MATLLQIAQLGHPILRKKALPVRKVRSKMIQNLIDNMLITLMDVNGVGLAAPQVYESKQIIIIASHPNLRYPKAPLMKPTPMINPKIIKLVKPVINDYEGCLSIPGIRALVPRYQKVQVRFFDRSGKQHEATYENFIARIIQHETDHLQGFLFTDRITSSRDLISESMYQKIITFKQIKKIS